MHSTGYLPMYIAMAKGYFAEADIDVKIVTIETGAGHTNAVLSGQAFAFIGGPEHNAFAKAKGAELRAVVHCVDRGNVYFCAAKGIEPKDTRLRRPTSKARRSRSAPFGGTPNSITRYLLKQVEARRQEGRHAATRCRTPRCPAGVRGGQAKIGVTTEPMITQGIKQGFWGEPFFNVPKELGPYAYSTINIRLDSIKKEPEVVRGFVRGMMKGLKFLYADQDGAADDRQEAVPDHGARRPQGHARPLVRRRDVEQGRHDQPRRLGHRQGRGDGAPAFSRPMSSTKTSST